MTRFPKREAAKQRTHRALVEAGIQEIAERGLEGASVRGVCGRAGLTQGAFYVHFESREAMLASCVEAAFARLSERLLRQIEEEGLHAVATRRYAAIQAGASDPLRGGPIQGLPVHHLLAACARFPHFQRRVGSVIARLRESIAKRILAGQQAGQVRVDVPAEDLAQDVIAFSMGVNAAVALGVPFEPESAARSLGRLLAPARA